MFCLIKNDFKRRTEMTYTIPPKIIYIYELNSEIRPSVVLAAFEKLNFSLVLYKHIKQLLFAFEFYDEYLDIKKE